MPTRVEVLALSAATRAVWVRLGVTSLKGGTLRRREVRLESNNQPPLVRALPMGVDWSTTNINSAYCAHRTAKRMPEAWDIRTAKETGEPPHLASCPCRTRSAQQFFALLETTRKEHSNKHLILRTQQHPAGRLKHRDDP